MRIIETAQLGVANPLLEDFSKPITEALRNELSVKEVRAIYPMIRAINSGRLTKNYTFYPAESLIGKNKLEKPTGYSSFVLPHGKPIITEHRFQDEMGMFGPGPQADVPMGRVVYASFRRWRKEDGDQTKPAKPWIPGSVEGDGSLYIVPAVTELEAINRILGGVYHTVSIGSLVERVTESISGVDLVAARRGKGEMPDYQRGQLYEGKLSYWIMGEIQGQEMSFVNNPSDNRAGVVDPDIGEAGIRLLVGEKKLGKKEFSFFDIRTKEKVDLDMDMGVVDESYFVDSVRLDKLVWWTDNANNETVPATEAAEDTEPAATGQDEDTIMELTKENLSKADIQVLKDLLNTAEKKEALLSLINELIKDNEDKVGQLVSGELTVEVVNEDLMKEVTEKATNLYEDWNEDAAKLALALYLQNEGEFKATVNPDAKMTFGKMFNLAEDHKLFNIETEITESEFAERGAVCNMQTAVLAMTLNPENKELAEKARAYGVLSLEDEDKKRKVSISPIFIEFTNGATLTSQPYEYCESKEQAKALFDQIDDIAEVYALDETQKGNLKTLLETIMDEKFVFEYADDATPLFTYESSENSIIKLGPDFLLNYFVKHESVEREYLQKLVGVVRKLGIGTNDVEQASHAYRYFGNAVLKKLLANAPTESKKEPPKEESSSTDTEMPSISQLPNPAAATEVTREGNTKDESETKSLLEMAYVRPRRKRQTLNDTKEIR